MFATVRFGPITVVPHRAKAGLFERSSILFRPHQKDIIRCPCGGAAGYRPRVRAAYYRCVYRHSLSAPPEYGKTKPVVNTILANLTLAVHDAKNRVNPTTGGEMQDATRGYLFGAGSGLEQAEREEAVRLILTSLGDVSRSPVPVMVGLSAEGVSLLTWLIDLGAAPEVYPPCEVIRNMSAVSGGVMMMIAPSAAAIMGTMAGRGEIRHRAGATDPAAIRIH